MQAKSNKRNSTAAIKSAMAGMFSSADLGRATGGNLHIDNLTTCVVALKEK